MTQDELLALIDQAAAEGWTELDLSGQELTELPPEIGKLTQLETLILGKQTDDYEQIENRFLLKVIGNNLTFLPAELAHLEKLRTLNLSGNPLAIILDSVTKLPNLHRLIGIRLNLAHIPESITQLQSLQELDLSNNQISEIPECIAQLQSLQQLVLFNNHITKIPECIAQLQSLQRLYLDNNQITEIPQCIAQLQNLQQLNLIDNQITKIPECIAQLQSLQRLYLLGNRITKLPKCISQLQKLQLLYLGSNQITEIPECIAQLQSLQQLDLNNNQISEIPECIAQLQSLQQLNLSNNQISEIPECIAQLQSIQQLYLGFNQISEIPECIAQLQSIQQLYLSSNQITEIPECIAQLQSLQQLYLSSNQISEIPECIAQLQSIQQLYLGSNQITEIPECIAQLQSIQQLYLGSNQITEIPECIAQLQILQRLVLWDNQISKIPDFLECLPQLKKLDVRRNPLPISPEILGPPEQHEEPGSVEDIFNYLRLLRSGEVKPLNEAKLLLVGQGSVGKTSLIERLLNNRFNPNESQTDGLNVSEWQVHVNTKDVRLNVWDFGGQEIYHATHQFFLTKRSLYLLVCNCRTSEEENRLEYWLKLIQSFGGESPVIIVGNKKDEQPLDINRKALRDKYPNIRAIIETSCQTGEGIDDLRSAILAQVAQLHDVYNLLPLSWFEVKEQLESMDRDFITYNEYIRICCQNQIPEEHNQEQLIDLLHNLGLVLNFRDHPILQSTNVLNPDWVTAGIYALLSDETLKTKTKGILTPADLSRILDPERYPAHRHHYLIELMKEEKFQLCFELPDCPAPKYLIPGLLPKEEPYQTGLEGDTLEFQYHYRILPEGVLSRFIVLSHEKIHNQVCWRSGVMLAYHEGNERYNIARIKADPEDDKIFISISGRESTRRVFLSLIRDTFTKIHRSFANLEVTEWVPVPGYPDHPPLDYQELLGLEAMGEREYPIGKLRIRVNLRQLLDGYEPLEIRRKHQFSGTEGGLPDFIESQKGLNINIFNTNQQSQGDNQPMTEIINNNQGSNIANFVNQANNNAQVNASNFTQNTGASTAELLQLIASLRQTLAQFPPEHQADLVIDIDDVEEEIKKPENERNMPKLKKRLTALATAATMLIGGVAAANNFIDEVRELSSNVGIELQLPPAQLKP